MDDTNCIKIATNLFSEDRIRLIESMPSGDSIIVVWLKLLCLAKGSKWIKYTDELLAEKFRRDVKIVRLALSVFKKYGMIEIFDDEIYIHE